MPVRPGANVIVCGVLLVSAKLMASRSDVPAPKVGSAVPLSSSTRVVTTSDASDS